MYKMTRSWNIGRLGGIVFSGASVLLAGVTMAEEPRSGGTLTVAPSSTSTTLINQVSPDTNTFTLSAKYLETLVAFDENGDYQPKLAESWSISDDQLTWTFKLRSGVKWHDGKALEAADIKWNMDNVWKKIWSNAALDQISEVHTPDDLTVELVMAEPVAPEVLLATLSQRAFVLAPHGFEGHELRESPQNQMATGTGPYRVKEFVPEQHVILERNPDYWDQSKPYLDRIIWRFINDQNSRVAALEAGEIDLVQNSALPYFDLARYRDEEGPIKLETRGYEGFTQSQILQFNVTREKLSDPRVRHAIAHAINKDIVASTTFLDFAAPATGMIPPTGKYYTADVPTYEFDPAKAEALLDEAGYPAGADGVRMTLNMVAPPFQVGTAQRTGQYVQQALKAVGIEIDFEILNLGAYFGRVNKQHDYDIDLTLPVYIADPCIATTHWYTSDAYESQAVFRNANGLQDPEMDAIVERACTAVTSEERAQALTEFQVKAAELLPILPLVDIQVVTAYRERVRNVGAGSQNWMYSDWADMWVAE